MPASDAGPDATRVVTRTPAGFVDVVTPTPRNAGEALVAPPPLPLPFPPPLLPLFPPSLPPFPPKGSGMRLPFPPNGLVLPPKGFTGFATRTPLTLSPSSPTAWPIRYPPPKTTSAATTASAHQGTKTPRRRGASAVSTGAATAGATGTDAVGAVTGAASAVGAAVVGVS